MGEYKATVVWERDGATFTDSRYSRGHRWMFDGGIEVPASSSPHVVRLPMSVEAARAGSAAPTASNRTGKAVDGHRRRVRGGMHSLDRRSVEGVGIVRNADRTGTGRR